MILVAIDAAPRPDNPGEEMLPLHDGIYGYSVMAYKPLTDHIRSHIPLCMVLLYNKASSLCYC